MRHTRPPRPARAHSQHPSLRDPPPPRPHLTVDVSGLAAGTPHRAHGSQRRAFLRSARTAGMGLAAWSLVGSPAREARAYSSKIDEVRLPCLTLTRSVHGLAGARPYSADNDCQTTWTLEAPLLGLTGALSPTPRCTGHCAGVSEP
jgi:hypothetical protein